MMDKQPYVHALHPRNCICWGCQGKLWNFNPIARGWSNDDMEHYARNWEEIRNSYIAKQFKNGEILWSPFVTSTIKESSMFYCERCEREQEHLEEDSICYVCATDRTKLESADSNIVTAAKQ